MDITELKRNRLNNRHPWEIVRAKIVYYFIRKYNPFSSHILDVGSGDAFILNYLCSNKVGKLYTAIDTAYTERIVKDIKQNINCPVNFIQQLPATLIPKTNCILLLDVLEHCKDDSALLQQLHTDKLIQSPVLFITVPAFQNLFSQHDNLLGHYRRYTRRQLKEVCRKNRYEVISSGYVFSSLLLIRAIQLLLEKIAVYNPKRTVDNWEAGSMVSTLITAFLWIDFIAGKFLSRVGLHLPGLSAYCICRPLPS